MTKHKLQLYRELQTIEDQYQEKMRKNERYAKIFFGTWLIVFSALLIYIFAGGKF